jgi:ribosome-associated protein
MPASDSVKALTQIAAQAAADKFGTDMIAIDLSDQLVLSEVFLIITGQNVRQVDAIADFVEEKLRLAGDKPVRREEECQNYNAMQILYRYRMLILHTGIGPVTTHGSYVYWESKATL